MKIIDVNKDNIDEYPATCFLNAKHEAYLSKKDWLLNRFKEGMKVKLLMDKKTVGFIEYVPGDKAWRAVDAKGWLFIHCIWVTPKNIKNKGHGSTLINEALKDAKGMNGVAVITSDDSFMANKDIFLKNGFTVAEESGKHQLLVKKLKDGKMPKLLDHRSQLKKYKGLNIVFSRQCPWVIRFIDELEDKDKYKIKELKTAKDAQNAPSIYSVFNLILDGRILADHYISGTRLKNILKKEGLN